MTTLTATPWRAAPVSTPSREAHPKPDWPLMSDVATIRAGVPEALIRWRVARGETAPAPSDPAFRRSQNSL